MARNSGRYHPINVGRRFAMIKPIYVESGRIYGNKYGLIDPDAYLPGTLVYGDPIEQVRNTNDDALLGKAKTRSKKIVGENMDDGESLAVGCKKPVDEIVLFDPDEETSETHTGGAWCPNVRELKMIQDEVVPSSYSGRTRLLVQAHYGCDRRDYGQMTFGGVPQFAIATVDSEGEYSGLFTVRNNPQESVGVYKDSDWNYWLTIVKTTTIEVRELKMSRDGDFLRKYVKKNGHTGHTEDQIDAYLLAACYASEDAYQIGAHLGFSGEPLGFGWNFNWDGDRADFVSIEQHPDPAYQDPTKHRWLSHHYRMILTDLGGGNTPGDRFVASVIEVDTQPWQMRLNMDHIWMPNYGLGMHHAFVPHGILPSPDYFDCDAPIYAYYDRNTLRVLRYEFQNPGDFAAQSYGNPDEHEWPFGGEPSQQGIDKGCGAWSFPYWGYSGDDTMKAGFYIDTVLDVRDPLFTGYFSANGVDDYYTGGQVENTGLTISDASWDIITNVCMATNPPTGGLQPPLSGILGYEERRNNRYRNSTGADGWRDWEPMVIIPFYDCQAVFMGYHEEVRLSTVSQTVKDSLVTTEYRGRYRKYISAIDDYILGPWSSWNDRGSWWFYQHQSYVEITNDHGGSVTGLIVETMHMDLILGSEIVPCYHNKGTSNHGDGGPLPYPVPGNFWETIFDITLPYDQNPGPDYESGGWHKYYDADLLVYPFVQELMFCKGSVGGSAWYNFKPFEAEENDADWQVMTDSYPFGRGAWVGWG